MTQHKIGLYNSVFENLNYGEALYGLQKLDVESFHNWFARSRGMVLNVHDFTG